jgi:hypothetical protein
MIANTSVMMSKTLFDWKYTRSNAVDAALSATKINSESLSVHRLAALRRTSNLVAAKTSNHCAAITGTVLATNIEYRWELSHPLGFMFEMTPGRKMKENRKLK